MRKLFWTKIIVGRNRKEREVTETSEKLPKLKRGLSNEDLAKIINSPSDVYSKEMRAVAWKMLRGRKIDIGIFMDIIAQSPEYTGLIYRKLMRQTRTVNAIDLSMLIDLVVDEEDQEMFLKLLLKKTPSC